MGMKFEGGKFQVTPGPNHKPKSDFKNMVPLAYFIIPCLPFVQLFMLM